MRLWARLNVVLADIRFHEPGLSIATVASDQGVSPRYLQRLLETTGTTFTVHVTELRLQHAFARLIGARDGTTRTSDIGGLFRHFAFQPAIP